MSFVMVYRLQDIENSIGKIYISMIMGVLMCIGEILMYDIHNYMFNLYYYCFFIGILFIIFILYKKQVGVNDNNYLKEMIEHHSMAILTSNEIINKTKNPDIKKFAENIVETQTKEIDDMREILKK
jgi:hypothetical protein